MARGVVPISPRQIDPLSWITGSVVPLILAGVMLLYALRALVVDAGRGDVVLELAAIVLFLAALLLLFAVSRGLRRTLGVPAAVAAVALGSGAMVVSAAGYAGHPFAVELWWAPMSLALVFGALGPYLPPRPILVIGAIAVAVVAPVSVLLIGPSQHPWGPVSIVVIVALPPLSGVLLAASFSSYVVRRMRTLLETRSQTVIVPRRVDPSTERAERARLAELTSRAVPFLERIVEAGGITDADRGLAGQLARRLRDDLVTQAGASWLDRQEDASRLVVVDPEDRADALRPPQRVALRGLIRTLLESEHIAAGSLLVELRSGADGATAVGITMDADLPEGRRMVFLAPALLTLETTAGSVDLIADEALRMSFEFPREQQPIPGARRRRPRFRR